MKWTARILLVMGLLLGFAGSSQAREPRLVIGYAEWFPYTYEEAGKATGFDIEICEAVLQRMGLTAEFRKYPWKRCLTSLEDRNVDALISMLVSPERAVYTLYPAEDISVSRGSFIVRADSAIEFGGSYENLRHTTVGVIMGFAYGEDFARAGLKTDETSDTRSLINKLLEGRNAVIVENRIVAAATARRMGVLERIRFLEPDFLCQKLYVGFARGHDDLCAEFSQELKAFKKTAAYHRILDKYAIDYALMIAETE